MKQGIIIFVALLVIILLNVWQVNYLKDTSKYMLTDINEIDNCVKREDFVSAVKGVEELEKTWNKVKSGWDVFGEHNDIEEMSKHIASMKVYAKHEEKEELINEYILFENLIQHVIESEELKLGNVL